MPAITTLPRMRLAMMMLMGMVSVIWLTYAQTRMFQTLMPTPMVMIFRTQMRHVVKI